MHQTISFELTSRERCPRDIYVIRRLRHSVPAVDDLTGSARQLGEDS